MHVDLVEARAERAQHGRERVDQRFGHEAERDGAFVRAAQLPDLPLDLLAFAEDRTGAREQPLADGGRHDPAIGAREQRRAERRLEALQLLRDAALREIERACGGAQAAVLDDGLEDAELGERERHGHARGR